MCLDEVSEGVSIERKETRLWADTAEETQSTTS